VLPYQSCRSQNTKKRAWRKDEVHQKAFDIIKATLAKDVALSYPDYFKEFDKYTDALSTQLGVVITQGNRPVAFFSRKLTEMQQHFSMTKNYLSIVEALKEFKGMLWEQRTKVYETTKTLYKMPLD
jgi:hypothetical protein